MEQKMIQDQDKENENAVYFGDVVAKVNAILTLLRGHWPNLKSYGDLPKIETLTDEQKEKRLFDVQRQIDEDKARYNRVLQIFHSDPNNVLDRSKVKLDWVGEYKKFEVPLYGTYGLEVFQYHEQAGNYLDWGYSMVYDYDNADEKQMDFYSFTGDQPNAPHFQSVTEAAMAAEKVGLDLVIKIQLELQQLRDRLDPYQGPGVDPVQRK